MPPRAPIRLVPAPAPALRLAWGDVVVPVVPATATGGAFLSVHVTTVPGAHRPTYIDHAADELVHVLSGSFTVVTSGGERFGLGPGETLCVPRGLPRRLECDGGRGGAREGAPDGSLLVTVTPGDVADELLAELRRQPPAADGRVDAVAVDLARYGIEVVAGGGA